MNYPFTKLLVFQTSKVRKSLCSMFSDFFSQRDFLSLHKLFHL
eukprot:UN05923